MKKFDPPLPEIMTAGELAALMRVDAKTVSRWDKEGKFPAAFRTLGGHRRYRREDVEKLLGGQS